MCRFQLNQFIERKEKKIKDFTATNLDFSIDQNNNVILSECSLCYVYKPKAYIFICGCKYVGLLCEHCLNWLEVDLFFCNCFEKNNFQLMPLKKDRVFPLLRQGKLYFLSDEEV